MNRWYIGYELKRSYPRNMTLSWLIVLAMIGCAALTIIIWPSSQDYPLNEPGPLNQHAIESAASGSQSSGSARKSVPAGSFPTGAPMYLGIPFPSGYIGPISIVRDYGPVSIALAPGDPLETPTPTDQPTEPMQENQQGAWSDSGPGDYIGSGDNPFGLPPTDPFMPVNRATPFGALTTGKIPLNRKANIFLHPASWPAKAEAFVPRPDSGVVWLTCLLETNGTISFTIDSAQPAGLGFKTAVEWSMKSSRYKPAVENGRPVPVAFTMTYIVRRNGPINWIQSSTGRINASVADPRW